MNNVTNMRLGGFVVHGPSVIRGSCFGVTLCGLNYVDPDVTAPKEMRAAFTSDPIDCMTCLVLEERR